MISLEQQIKAKAETQKKAGIELEATCQVCLKTKFADGIGHLCNYCNVRCCARCGGKVTLRSNKSIWVCILCRKKQELLIKSGKWMSGGGVPTNNDPILRKIELDMAPTPGWSQASVIWLKSTCDFFYKSFPWFALPPQHVSHSSCHITQARLKLTNFRNRHKLNWSVSLHHVPLLESTAFRHHPFHPPRPSQPWSPPRLRPPP